MTSPWTCRGWCPVTTGPMPTSSSWPARWPGTLLFSLVHPWRKVQQRYEGNREAQPVLEYLACVREINTCASPDRAVQLIKRHSFDTECVPTHLRGHLPVFEAALVRMPLRGVLTQLRVMTSP